MKITLPALSPTMETGNLVKWLVKENQEVKSGEVLAEIETDKATMELESPDDGVITKILVPENSENVKVNTEIAILKIEGEEEGEDSVDIEISKKPKDQEKELTSIDKDLPINEIKFNFNDDQDI